MRMIAASLTLFLAAGSSAAQAGNLPSDSSMKMEMHGGAIAKLRTAQKLFLIDLINFRATSPLINIKVRDREPVSEATGAVRSAKGGQIYRAVSPAVWCWSLPRMVSGLARCLILLGTS